MKKFLTVLSLFSALSFLAAAQTTTNVPGITLSGPVADPTIVNHSGKPVVAALMVLTDANGLPWWFRRLFTHDSLGLPDGGSVRWGTFSKYQKLDSPIVAAKIMAVIFSDGEFRGEESHEFQATMERYMQSMRQIWQMAKDGNWDGVKAKAAGDTSRDSFGVVTAIRLLEPPDNDRAKAVESLKHFGLLPTTVWKSGLLNKLQFAPNFFQAFFAWIMPVTVHAQNPQFCCVFPYPQGTGTDGNHPTQYTYFCNTNDDTIPCPPVGQTLPSREWPAFVTPIPTMRITSRTRSLSVLMMVDSHVIIAIAAHLKGRRFQSAREDAGNLRTVGRFPRGRWLRRFPDEADQINLSKQTGKRFNLCIRNVKKKGNRPDPGDNRKKTNVFGCVEVRCVAQEYSADFRPDLP